MQTHSFYQNRCKAAYGGPCPDGEQHTCIAHAHYICHPPCVSICQHMSAYVSIPALRMRNAFVILLATCVNDEDVPLSVSTLIFTPCYFVIVTYRANSNVPLNIMSKLSRVAILT